MHEKIYIGIDGGNRPGYKTPTADSDKDWFTIAAVVTSDFSAATEVNNEITARWGLKKGVELHKYSKEICELLLNYPLRYFVFAFNKYSVPPFFARNYKNKKFSFSDSPKDLPYSAITKLYTKHGWLTIDTLRKYGYKGETEIRIDRDLQGKAWRQYEREVKTHAENCLGSCDLKMVAGMEYPLVRIADIVANHAYNHLRKKKIGPKNQFHQILEQLQNETVLMRLRIREKKESTPKQKDFSMKMETYEPTIAGFCPWGK